MVYLIASISTILIALLWVDVVTYAGFSSTFLIAQKYFVLLAIGFATCVVAMRSHRTRPHKSMHILMMSGVLLYLVSLTIDGVAGQGATYDLVRLRPESMMYAVLGSLTLYAMSIVQPSPKKGYTLMRFVGLIAVFFFAVRLAPIVTTQAAINMRNILSHPQASYDDKMKLEWGVFYEHMMKIKSETSADSVIAIPADRRMYPLHGNAELVRYFLYPRTLTIGVSDQSEYVMVVKGDILSLEKLMLGEEK